METQRKRKVLLAEDDSDDAFFFFDFLRHRTDVDLLPSLTNGAEVLDYLDAITQADDLPDIILLDQNMPKLTGMETLESIKAVERYNRIAIAIYSTYVGPQLAADGLRLGASFVETKPSTKDEYNQLLDSMLGVTQAR